MSAYPIQPTFELTQPSGMLDLCINAIVEGVKASLELGIIDKAQGVEVIAMICDVMISTTNRQKDSQ